MHQINEIKILVFKSYLGKPSIKKPFDLSILEIMASFKSKRTIFCFVLNTIKI